MKDKKLQVFVSSTYTDLKEERQAAVEAILSSRNIPAGMELFSAGDESQMTVIKRWIDESDVYLLILGGRYGSIDAHTGKSYTHLEYEYAISIGKPLFAVVINESALEKKVLEGGGISVIERDNPKELKEFRATVTKNLVKFWDDKKDIKLAIHETLSDFSDRKELVGWIRGDNSVNTGMVLEELARLTKENDELRSKVNNNGYTALYAGLTYEQLEELLKREAFTLGEKTYNLFDYMISVGKRISNKDHFSNSLNEGLEKMQLFKLVKLEDVNYSYSTSVYAFTDDGHNFYLKALLLNPSMDAKIT